MSEQGMQEAEQKDTPGGEQHSGGQHLEDGWVREAPGQDAPLPQDLLHKQPQVQRKRLRMHTPTG